MKIIAVTNRKGGVGKTTVAHCLGHGIARRGKKVLALDLDTQGNLSMWCNATDGGATLADVVLRTHTLADVARPIWRADDGQGRFDLVAGGDRLYMAEGEVDRQHALSQAYLADELADLPEGAWDVVLMDTAPSLSVFWSAAIVAASWIIVPTEPSAMGVEAMGELKIRMSQLSRLGTAELAGVVVSPYNSRTRLEREALEAITELAEGSPVWTVRRNVAIAEAFAAMEPIYGYEPRSHAATDYGRIADQVVERLDSGS